MAGAKRFFESELAHGVAWADHALSAEERHNWRGPRFVERGAGLYPGSRAAVRDYIERHRLKPHSALDHLLSSQAFCFNFLGPFLDRPAALADLLRPMAGDGVTPIQLPGEQGFVAFEYISGPDYLNEGGKGPRQRGSQCTSVDAAVGYVRAGRRELLLMEWKLGERYGAPLRNRVRATESDAPADSNAERRRRYEGVFAKGVTRPGLRLEAFFYEPFYQLLRQQMLAAEIEADDVAPESAFDRVTLAHVSPDANEALKRVTAPELRPHYPPGVAACAGWRDLLTRPERYRAIHVETLFAAFPLDRHPDLRNWHGYMLDRYSFLQGRP